MFLRFITLGSILIPFVLRAQSSTCNLDSVIIDTVIYGQVKYLNLGSSVAMSGDGKIVAIGAPGHNRGLDFDVGRVNIYEKVNGKWEFRQALFGSQEEELFGSKVALSGDGNVLVISAPGYDASYSYDQGAVVIAYREGDSWKPRDTILGTQEKQRLGMSLDLSYDGTRLVIGSPKYDVRFSPSMSSNDGKAELYHRENNQWVLKLTVFGSETGDHLGRSVSISGDGNIVVVGSPFASPQWNQEGRVLVYKWRGISWRLQTSINGTNPGEKLGFNVDLDFHGNWLAIKTSFGNNKGKVLMYSYNSNNQWSLFQEIIGPNTGTDLGAEVIKFLGKSTRLLIGAGAEARFYMWDKSEWLYLRSFNSQNPYSDPLTSAHSDLDGERIVFGFPTEYNPSGLHSAGKIIIFDQIIMPYFVLDTLIACDSFVSASGKVWFEPGTYYDTVTALNGCDSIIEYNIVDVQLTEPVSIYASGDSLWTDYPSLTYIWFKCITSGYNFAQITTQNSFHPPESGSYAVGVYQGPCLTFSECIYITSVTNVNNKSEFVTINNDFIQIKFPTNSDVSLKIYDIVGKEVYSEDLRNKGSAIINLFELNIRGNIILIQIVTSESTYIYKVSIH
ncbi:MAG: hypothetical protein GXO48_07665 [Chlorobi bacterium]|nr:hypothetical protein [Chlorobiota bacterium]